MCASGDKLKEALNKVRLKIAFAPLPLGGVGGGAQLRQKRKANYVCAGFQPARDLFGIDS